MNKAIKSVRKRVISDMLTGPLPGSDPDSKRANKRINSLKSKISKADEALAAIDSILCTTYPEKCLLDALEKDERKLLEKMRIMKRKYQKIKKETKPKYPNLVWNRKTKSVNSNIQKRIQSRKRNHKSPNRRFTNNPGALRKKGPGSLSRFKPLPTAPVSFFGGQKLKKPVGSVPQLKYDPWENKYRLNPGYLRSVGFYS